MSGYPSFAASQFRPDALQQSPGRAIANRSARYTDPRAGVVFVRRQTIPSGKRVLFRQLDIDPVVHRRFQRRLPLRTAAFTRAINDGCRSSIAISACACLGASLPITIFKFLKLSNPSDPITTPSASTSRNFPFFCQTATGILSRMATRMVSGK